MKKKKSIRKKIKTNKQTNNNKKIKAAKAYNRPC